MNRLATTAIGATLGAAISSAIIMVFLQPPIHGVDQLPALAIIATPGAVIGAVAGAMRKGRHRRIAIAVGFAILALFVGAVFLLIVRAVGDMGSGFH